MIGRRLWVRRLEYPKYKIPSQPQLNIVQAVREANLIPGGSFGFGLAAEVLFNKFGLHLPLYRQQDPLAQLGWVPSRSTLSQIIANAAELLRPLALLETQRILASGVVNTDDTPVTLLTPGEGQGSRQARFWIYRSRQVGALYDAFAFTDNRSRAGPDEFLKDFQGTLCGDCYSGYVNIEDVTGGRIVFSACNAHARRYVFNAREQHPELSSQILALYRRVVRYRRTWQPLGGGGAVVVATPRERAVDAADGIALGQSGGPRVVAQEQTGDGPRVSAKQLGGADAVPQRWPSADR